MSSIPEEWQRLIDGLDTQPDLQLRLLRVLISKKNVQELLLQDTELLLIVRGLIVGEGLARLPGQVEEIKQIALQGVQVGREALQAAQQAQQASQQALEAAQQAQQASQQALEAAQQAQQTAEQAYGVAREGLRRLDKLEADMENLKGTVARIEARQRGEEGRRRGEELEKRVRRQAFRLFNDGEGGTPDDPQVQVRLRQWLTGRLELNLRIRDIDDPTLADLIWWKGERVLVVEVSLQVNGDDVQRARLRAETLRQAGVDVLPVVIGEEWATPASRELAKQAGVAWKIGDEMSEQLIEFRKLVV